MRHHRFALALSWICATSALAQPATHTLDNGTVKATISEQMGGRLLTFSLAGQPNFLKVDVKAGDPSAPVDARTDNIGYMGHEMWVGPQSQWWAHQTVHRQHAAKKAVWPPDPFLSLTRYTLKTANTREVVLASPASPVNGLQLTKRYALVENQPNSLQLDASAINTRSSAVAWDLWFNTRVHPDTLVYVPVASKADVRTAMVGEDPAAPLSYTLADGMLSLDLLAPPPGHARRSGKAFIQPAHGWMAGFNHGQAFIIQFALQPRSAIHPEQGQVELYHDFQPASPGKGLLEMEVHAPYVKLAPGKSMRAAERWTILPYTGPATRAAHLGFLRAQAQRLGLKGL